ncbi:taste receptor type 2 member 4-like [Suncus etruscus]|uniref:taste receptor type 2 member 4-like n=1 Tax=Suncus etruscus TaxID=109475 RepID=UPI0021103090|nr:taste receptor type 2 member 4-like [Suncus etruscus]
MRHKVFLSTVIVATIFHFAGLIANLFIAIFYGKNWIKNHRIASSDRILLSLGIVRFLMMALFLIKTICIIIFPSIFGSVQVFIFFLVCWMFLDSNSLWLVTLLNALYCVKISNFQHTMFLLLKQNFSSKIPGLLLAGVLISVFLTFLYIGLRLTLYPAVSVSGKNVTELDMKNVLSSVACFVLSSSLQFIMNVTSASLLINSLRRHIQKMQRNATGFWNPQVEAHVGTMKLMICFLIFYIPYFVATMLYSLGYFARLSVAVKSGCMVISSLYHPGHSILIILTHPKLKTKAKKILCFN